MITVYNIDVYNIARAVYSARNAMNSWDRSDSDIENDIVGKNDLELMQKLYKAGSEHRKYLRQIFVCMDITAPLYWWKEFDTYKIGTVANSCSTMHTIHKKEFELDDFSYEHLISGYAYTDLLDVEGSEIGVKVSPDSLLNVIIGCLNNYRMKYLETKDKKWWWQMIQLLPSSYNQKRTVTMNYENVVNIIHQRENHKLDEWNVFCDIMLEKLPYLKEIMEYDKTNGCSKGNG